MNKPICLIRQPAGLGDILVCLKIGYHMIDLGYDVIWPVIPEYEYLSKYLITPWDFPVITDDYLYKNMIKSDRVYFDEHLLYLPLEKASLNIKNGGDISRLFLEKYQLAKVSIDNWQNFVDIKRDKNREDFLYNFYDIRDTDEYIFVNKMFASPPNIQYININLDTEYEIIEMRNLGSDNIFDWLKIIEYSQEIHTVQTSLQFIIEVLNFKQPKYIYPRIGLSSNFSYLDSVFNKDEWNYIC